MKHPLFVRLCPHIFLINSTICVWQVASSICRHSIPVFEISTHTAYKKRNPTQETRSSPIYHQLGLLYLNNSSVGMRTFWMIIIRSIKKKPQITTIILWYKQHNIKTIIWGMRWDKIVRGSISFASVSFFLFFVHFFVVLSSFLFFH